MPVPDVMPSCTRLLIHNGAAQVLTAVEEFALVRDKLHELGQPIDHDQSGLVYTPLTDVEVCPAYPWLRCPALEYVDCAHFSSPMTQSRLLETSHS